ncbi:Nephrocystin-3 [Mycena sanguinolenta]|uniref:Nephrocystin-3 n=1 Tax=Mycena sanguinolenta TaxID=230812 RepID=A0A8H7CMJ4_9AGAR|nr:Nephrocystin-3 [Mycena sanguinolenta]
MTWESEAQSLLRWNPAVAEIPQQGSILALPHQLEGTMLSPDHSGPLQLSIIGGQGGPGGQGHSCGTGGRGGDGLGPTLNITAQEFNLHAMSSSEQGRRDILDQMHDFFTSNGGIQKISLLYGLGGAGKTQIALKFIKEFSSNFSDVFFIDTSTIATIDTGLKNIAIMKHAGDSLEEGLLWLISQNVIMETLLSPPGTLGYVFWLDHTF